MGKVKDPEERKSEIVKIRVTPKEKELLGKFQRIKGYGSISRFILETLLDPQPTRRLTKQVKEEIRKDNNLIFMQKEISELTNQIKGLAKNYNQIVTLMNTLIKTADKSSTRRLIIKKMTILDHYTRQAIDLLKEIKSLINK